MGERLAREILVVNGPSLNLLGTREPHLYGRDTLADAEHLARDRGRELGFGVDFFQSNFEGEIIERLHAARETVGGVVVNPAGLTSVSISLLDALLALDRPVVEVHVTNIHRREAFRQFSYVSTMADAVIAGAGIAGYGFAVAVLAERIDALSKEPGGQE